MKDSNAYCKKPSSICMKYKTNSYYFLKILHDFHGEFNLSGQVFKSLEVQACNFYLAMLNESL